MGKIARERSTALVSRSGLWLIGIALLFSAAVLAWAFQSDAPRHPSGAAPGSRRQAPRPMQGRAASRSAASEPGAWSLEPGAGAKRPSVSDYALLLEDNAFQPRVIPRRAVGAHKPSEQPAERKPAGRSAAGGNAAPDADGAWHGWKYNGIAQLDEQTYALMDQPNQKRSRFVKEGDRLEDATIARVAENEVDLRQADGSVVRVPRVDAMAELLRPARPMTPPPGPVAAPTGTTPAAPIPGQGPVTILPSGQAPQGLPATAAVEGPSPSGSFARRGRRFRQQDGTGDTGEP